MAVVGWAFLLLFPKFSLIYCIWINAKGRFELGRFIDLYIADLMLGLLAITAFCHFWVFVRRQRGGK